MKPEISVVIPTRNRWPLLRRALGGVFAQRGVALEVLVVDDGSSDGSAERAESITDPRLKVLRQDRAGVAAARNRGIESAAAAWVALLDDDDLWAPDKCRLQLATLAERRAEVAFSSQVVVDEALRAKRVLQAPDPERLLTELLGSNVIGTPSSVMASREALLSAGGFDDRFSVLADWDMWLRLCAGRPAAARTETLVAYVEHDANLHLLDTDSVMREFGLLRRRHRALEKELGESMGDINWWRWIASSYRRAGRRNKASRAYLQTGLRFGSGRDLARSAAVLGGERVMKRLAGSAPPALESRKWQWLERAGRFAPPEEGDL
jgi:glycosyltransferase involved in cell wall biosynthesis